MKWKDYFYHKQDPWVKKQKEVAKKIREELMQDGNNILLGKVDGKEIGIAIDFAKRNSNVLVVGCGGTGKTYGYVLSNLLQSNALSIVVDEFGHTERCYGDILLSNGCKIHSFYAAEFLHFLREVKRDSENFGRFFDCKKDIIFLHNAFGEDCIQEIGKEIMFIENRTMPVNFYLDDFFELGKVKDMSKLLVIARRHRVGFHLIVRNFDCLEMIYGEEGLAILACCQTVLFTGAFDPSTLKFISQRLDGALTSNEILKRRRDCEGRNWIVFTNGLSIECTALNPKDYQNRG